MKGYLSVENTDSGRVAIETRTEIYRDPENSQYITIETSEQKMTVDIADVTVSRKKNGKAPVVITPESECIEVRNEGNSNGIHVQTEGDQKEIGEGFSARIRRDAVLQIGYQTKLRLTVNREAREEYVIDGDVKANGDVVMGDQRNVDERTTVEDVVAKELEVDSDGSAEVKDTVGNKIDTGENEKEDTQTQNICEEHGVYTGPVCPDCAEVNDSEDESQSTKFCIYCGEPVPVSASSCSNCGKEFPDMN